MLHLSRLTPDYVTCMGKNGKQYVVVEAFGGPGIVAVTGCFNGAPGDSVIAFALP